MNAVKQSKRGQKFKIYHQQLFFNGSEADFTENCQRNCRCLFWKPNHEWTLKHVLDKEPLIYHMTGRRQVGHWTRQGWGFFFILTRRLILHINLHKLTNWEKWSGKCPSCISSFDTGFKRNFQYSARFIYIFAEDNSALTSGGYNKYETNAST